MSVVDSVSLSWKRWDVMNDRNHLKIQLKVHEPYNEPVISGRSRIFEWVHNKHKHCRLNSTASFHTATLKDWSQIIKWCAEACVNEVLPNLMILAVIYFAISRPSGIGIRSWQHLNPNQCFKKCTKLCTNNEVLLTLSVKVTEKMYVRYVIFRLLFWKDTWRRQKYAHREDSVTKKDASSLIWQWIKCQAKEIKWNDKST